MSVFPAFGQQQKQPAALFGASTPQAQPNIFGGFGQQNQNNSNINNNNNNNNQQQQQQQPQPQQPALFGGQNQSTGTGLFASTNNASNTPGNASQPTQPSTNLFGSTTQQQQQPAGAGLFGQPSTTGTGSFRSKGFQTIISISSCSHRTFRRKHHYVTTTAANVFSFRKQPVCAHCFWRIRHINSHRSAEPAELFSVWPVCPIPTATTVNRVGFAFQSLSTE